MRQFIDQHGGVWDVFEVMSEAFSVGRPEMLPTAFRGGWLAFDNGLERRRLAPYPPEWQGFPNAGLCALLDAAQVVGPRVRRDLVVNPIVERTAEPTPTPQPGT